MDALRLNISRILVIAALAVVVSLVVTARAQALPYVISNPGGGDCAAIGTWNLSAHTCTLNVKVRAVLQGTANGRPVIASQRVLWNGYFNEVWGQ